MLNRTLPPAIQPLSDFPLTKAQNTTLDNGLEVFVIKAGEQPILHLQLLFPAGKTEEVKKGVAALTAKMLLEGTRSYSAKQLSNAFDSIGTFKAVNAGFELITLDFYFLERYLDKICPLVSTMITEANFDEQEFALTKTISQRQLQVNLEKVSYVANALFREKFFGEASPYGYKLAQNTLEQVNVEDLKMHYAENICQHGFKIIVAGMVSDEHLALLNTTLGQLPIQYPFRSNDSLRIKTERFPAYYQEKEKAMQTALRLGCPVPNIKAHNRIAVEVLNEILGGYFGSRLMKNIREEKGLTYGISSSIVNMQKASYLLIGTEVKKTKREEAISEITKEVEVLKKEVISEEELSLVKYHMASSYIKSINTPLAVSDYFKTIHFQNLSATFFDNYISKIQSVSAEDIKKTAQEIFELPLLEVTVG